MKNTKKILLFGVGAMAALALGVGATSTFAWFTATRSATVAGLSATPNDLIRVENNATVDPLGMQVAVVWDTMPNVDLTADGQTLDQDFGKTYVIDQNNALVPANNQDQLTKYAVGSLTIDQDTSKVKKDDGNGGYTASTEEDRALLEGTHFDVYVAADGHLRIGTALEGTAPNKAVGYSDSYKVKVGTVTIHHRHSFPVKNKSQYDLAVWTAYNDAYGTSYGNNDDLPAVTEEISYVYANVGTDFSGVTNKLSFYYSVSPMSTDTTLGAESESVSYGSLSASLS